MRLVLYLRLIQNEPHRGQEGQKMSTLGFKFKRAKTKPTTRRTGEAATLEERSTWSNSKVIHQLKMSIRTDFGGKKTEAEKKQVVLDRVQAFVEKEEACTNLIEKLATFNSDELDTLARIIMAQCTHTRDGIAKRVKNHLDELERRLSKPNLIS